MEKLGIQPLIRSERDKLAAFNVVLHHLKDVEVVSIKS